MSKTCSGTTPTGDLGHVAVRRAATNSLWLEDGEHLCLRARDGSGFALLYHLTGPEAGLIRPIKGESTYREIKWPR